MSAAHGGANDAEAAASPAPRRRKVDWARVRKRTKALFIEQWCVRKVKGCTLSAADADGSISGGSCAWAVVTDCPTCSFAACPQPSRPRLLISYVIAALIALTWPVPGKAVAKPTVRRAAAAHSGAAACPLPAAAAVIPGNLAAGTTTR